MSLDLNPLEPGAAGAIMHFWNARTDAAHRQRAGGAADHGERAGVTAGKNMDGFVHLLTQIARSNGLANAQVCSDRTALTLPGYFRATKNWDLLILNGQRLVAAVEFKSQVGPSLGNNFNNRAEEAIGTAHDFWTAYRTGAFGTDLPRPFVGWLMLIEDTATSRAPGQHLDTPHFDVSPEFRGASYIERYDILCRKLMLENLYSHASVITTPTDGGSTGVYGSASQMTSLQAFAAAFASYCAADVFRSH